MEQEIKVHWLDRAVGYVWPAAGYRMAFARWQLNHFVKNYDAARKDNLWMNWMARNQPGELQDANYRQLMIARCRDLERNSDTANSIILAILRNVVGKGMQLQARVRSPSSDQMDEKTIKKLEEYWRDFILKNNCDITGMNSFKKFCEMIERRKTFDGEIFLIEVYDKDSKEFPYKLQMMEFDQLDMSRTENNGNRIYSGIEVDSYNRPVAYWFQRLDLMGIPQSQPERILADRVIHLANRTRSTQIHGIPRIAQSVSKIRDIDSYLEAENVKSKLAACFGIAITTNNTQGPQIPGKMNQQTGFNELEIAPGMIARLGPNESLQVVAPNLPTQMGEYTTINMRAISSGQGFSYEQISRDYSQTNYSSARVGLIEDQKAFSQMQDDLKDDFCIPVYKKAIEAGVLAGSIDLKDFSQEKRRYLEHKWIPPGWSLVDPLKEVQAYQIALALGLTTLEEIAANQGKDWAEQLKQRAREVEEAERLGLDIVPYPNKEREVIDGDEEPKKSAS